MLLRGIVFNEHQKLTDLEKTIFDSNERKRIQQYGKRPVLARFKVDLVSGCIVCVSFTFRNIDDQFYIDEKKLAKYREEIKKNKKYDNFSFEGGDVVAGYYYQIMPVFID